MNQINIIGRMGKDPDLKTTTSGKQVASFSVAVTRQFDKEKSDWFNVTVWGKDADFASRYLGKGRLVAVSGRMESREYDGKTYWDVTADRVQGLDRPTEGQPTTRAAEDEYDPFAD
jgi:single-strand DNA-binding protein